MLINVKELSVSGLNAVVRSVCSKEVNSVISKGSWGIDSIIPIYYELSSSLYKKCLKRRPVGFTARDVCEALVQAMSGSQYVDLPDKTYRLYLKNSRLDAPQVVLPLLPTLLNC